MRTLTAMLLMAAATPVAANTVVVPAFEKNALDDAADVDWEVRRQFMHRTFRATRQQLAKDICERHGMHKVTTKNSWRCKK
jgi:hypothetical protein